MTKYISAEKLTAEIERLIEETKSADPPFDLFWAGQISAFRCVGTVIASLQQEQPEVDIDIQQELYHHFGQVKDFTLGVAIASYFYELGLNAREK